MEVQAKADGIIKKEKVYDIVLAAILAVSIVCMTRVEFNGDVWGMLDVNYMNRFGLSAVVLWGILFFAILFSIRFIDVRMSACLRKFSGHDDNVRDKRKIILLWAVIIFIAWIPYYLSY